MFLIKKIEKEVRWRIVMFQGELSLFIRKDEFSQD
jgi:hypothetical protein